MAITGPLTGPLTSGIVGSITGIIQRYFTEAFAVASSRIDLTTPIPIGAEVTMLVYPTSGNTGLPSDAPLVTDDKLQEITFTLTAPMASIFYNGTSYFSGIIANVVATQSGTVLLNMPINESGVSNTVIDYSGQNNHGTRVNMTTDNVELYTQDGVDWLGAQLLTSLSIPEEVTDNGDGTYTVATTALRQLEEMANGSELGLVYRFKYDVISITSGAFSTRAGGTFGISVSTPTNDVQDDIVSGATSPTGLRFVALSGTSGTFRPKSIKRLLETI